MYNNVLQKLNLSSDVVKGMWQKACLLVLDKLSISEIPGGCKKDRYVLSKPGTQPHAIKCSGKVYKCDD